MDRRAGVGDRRSVASGADAQLSLRASAFSQAGRRSSERGANAKSHKSSAGGEPRSAAQAPAQAQAMISLAGKAALVTGGSRGIGAATVKVLAEAGDDVVFNFHRQREAAAKVELEARKHGTRVESFQADLGRMADAKKLVSRAIKSLGRLDILVVNAGIWNSKDVP